MAAPINPRGGKPDKIWREALMLAIKREAEDGGKHIDRLARALVAKASEGDVAALREIGDRLDGKPTQDVAIEHSGEITQVSAAVSVLDSFFADQAPGTAYRPDPNVVPN